MSRLLIQSDGVSIDLQTGLTPDDHVVILHGPNVAVLDTALPLPTTSGLPRTDYARRYNVIPPNATEAQAVAIFLDGWRRAHETAGGSYDDAGLGALYNKTAILYGVEDREAEFRQWFAQYYVGTRLEFRPLPEVTE